LNGPAVGLQMWNKTEKGDKKKKNERDLYGKTNGLARGQGDEAEIREETWRTENTIREHSAGRAA